MYTIGITRDFLNVRDEFAWGDIGLSRIEQHGGMRWAMVATDQPERTPEALEGFDALLVLRQRIDADLLAAAPRLRHVSRMTMITEAQVAVVQPDVGKWGGISGALVVGRAARSAGLRFCPHWLAGGLGLAASLQVQAALGGEDLVELDANPNPLRQALCDPQLKHGRVILDDAPGLGPDDPIAALASAAT